MENNFNQNTPVPEEPTQDTCQDASQYYRLSAFAGALYNVYFSWAYNGYQETPQQLAQVLNVPCTEQPPCRWQPAR